MSQFVCEPCRVEFKLRVTDYIVKACCELCGRLRNDWSEKLVAFTAGNGFSYTAARKRAKMLQNIAKLHEDRG